MSGLEKIHKSDNPSMFPLTDALYERASFRALVVLTAVYVIFINTVT